VHLRRGVTDLQPAVVPVLGEGAGGYTFEGLRYVVYARHGQVSIVQSRAS